MNGFVKSKDNLEKYNIVYFKNSSVVTVKVMEEIKAPDYTELE